jgi:hypothetical protein
MECAMTDAVSYRMENGVAWLTIERPEARNALNAAVRTGLFAGTRRFTTTTPRRSWCSPAPGRRPSAPAAT